MIYDFAYLALLIYLLLKTSDGIFGAFGMK